MVLSCYDEGPDLVLYHAYVPQLFGDTDDVLQISETDELSVTQWNDADRQLRRFIK